MSYERVTPRARQGTTGICEEYNDPQFLEGRQPFQWNPEEFWKVPKEKAQEKHMQ